MNYRRSTIISIIVFMTLMITLTPPVYSTELSASDKATEFLSSVVGLDLAKYTLISPLPPSGYNASQYPSNSYRYPPEFCGLVKEEVRSYKYEANESKVDTMSIFYNEQLVFFKIEAARGNYIYSEAPSTDLINQAKTILQRYQIYANHVYATDNSYLKPMQNILNSISDLSPTNITAGNLNFQVSKNDDNIRVQWIYTENNVIMNYKRLELNFRNNAFESMIDNWRILSVGGFSVINAEEAYKLALETAQSTEFRIVNEYRNESVALPDLSKSGYQMYFTTVPYRNLISHNPSKISRDPLTLYPYWQFYFYFKGGTIGGYSGVQVGIWGDTKEIVYCNGFGFLGASAPTEEEQLPISAPSNQASSEPTEQQTQSIYSNTLIIAVAISTITVVTILSLLIFRRIKKTTKLH